MLTFHGLGQQSVGLLCKMQRAAGMQVLLLQGFRNVFLVPHQFPLSLKGGVREVLSSSDTTPQILSVLSRAELLVPVLASSCLAMPLLGLTHSSVTASNHRSTINHHHWVLLYSEQISSIISERSYIPIKQQSALFLFLTPPCSMVLDKSWDLSKVDYVKY